MAQRRNKTMRDMGVCMAVLVAALLLVVGSYGGFSFAPGGPSDGEAPTADAVAGFEKAGPVLDFESVVPRDLPAEWNANVFLVKTELNWGAGTVPLARGGWLTGNGEYIALIESAADPQSVLTQEIGPGLASAGTIDAGGRTWSLYPGVRDEVVWVASDGDSTLVITGSAVESDFITLARSLA